MAKKAKMKYKDADSRLRQQEELLYDMLEEALSENKKRKKRDRSLCDLRFLKMADAHKITPLIYDAIKEMAEYGSDIVGIVQDITDRTVVQWYHLLLETVRMVSAFREAGIEVIVLKGAAVSSFYAVPEYRKSGDIDFLLTVPESLKDAVELTKRYGYHVSEEQHALHHVVMETQDGINLELHTSIAEPFDNAKINKYMDLLLPDIRRHILYKTTAGFQIPILDDDYQAYELLLHMLQHFLREGFGLRLLCDWTRYWNQFDAKEHAGALQRYLALVEESKIAGFSNVISAVCRYFLGMEEEIYRKLVGDSFVDGEDLVLAEEFLKEVMQSGEFGKGERGRMVALRDESIFAYIREFQHQMHLNFPKGGRIFLLWPALWIFTLGRFMKNNRTLRNVSSREIFESARKRSGLMKKMDLWK